MANRFFGEVSVAVEDRNFTLRMDMNAMCEFEDATGVSAMDAFQQAETGGGGIRQMRQIVFAALQHHHADATLKDAGDILSQDTHVVQKLMAATAPEVEAEGKPRAGAKTPA